MTTISERGTADKETKLYEYVYDRYGNLTKEILAYDSTDKTIGTLREVVSKTYTYEFDLAGNILETRASSGDHTKITKYRAVRVIR